MFRTFFQWLLGSVEFAAEGGFPERFINLMEEKGIPAQYLIPNSIGFIGAVRPEQYCKLRPIARKSGMKIRMKQKTGLPFFVDRYHHRKGLLVGLFCLCSMLLVLQMFVWSVSIEGCKTLEESYIRQQLQETGIYTGALIPEIDAVRCQREMMMRVPELSWIAINVQGSTITVKLRERVMPPPEVDREDAAANVISSRTGVIREMEVYSGQPLVQVGEAVWEGRMLVSGIFVSNQHTLVRYARAKIIAEVEESIVIEIPLIQKTKSPTGELVTQYTLSVGKRTILLNPWKTVPENAISHVEQIYLPFGIALLSETYEACTNSTTTYNRESAKSEALRQLTEREIEHFPQGYLTRELHGTLEDGFFILTANYTCLRDVALTQEILTDGSL